MDSIQPPVRFSLSWKWGGAVALGLLLSGWLLNTPGGLLGKADAIGYAVCHRIDARSFHLGERAVPLCARCSGMYLGALLGLGYQAVLSRRRMGMPPWRVIFFLGWLVVAFGIDGVNSFLHIAPFIPPVYPSQNWLRLLTGTGMGLVIAAMLYPAFNQTLWQDPLPQPALPGLKALGGLVGLAVAMDLLVLTENPLILYPAALLSAAGVLVLLTLVYCMSLILILRQENRLTGLAQSIWPLAGGFGIGLLQIVGLDLIRFALTRTWDGFHIGL